MPLRRASRSVAPRAGWCLSAGGQNRAIFLAPTAVDWDVKTDVSLDKAPVGGGSAWVYHEVRRSSSNTDAYRLVARFAGNGTHVPVPPRAWSDGTETQIGSAVAVPTVNFLTGFTLRGQVTGANPTTIRIKAWVGTEPETWQYTATDSLGPQVAGRGGLRGYTSGSTTNVPLTFLLDNYSANEAVPRRLLRLRRPPPPPPPPPPRLLPRLRLRLRRRLRLRLLRLRRRLRRRRR